MLNGGDRVVVLDTEEIWEDELDGYIGEQGTVVLVAPKDEDALDEEDEELYTLYLVGFDNGDEAEFFEDELDLADEEEALVAV